VRIVRFRPEHLRALALQDEQQAMQTLLDQPEYGPALSLAGPAFTVLVDDLPVVCIGVQEITPHRAEAWALLGQSSGPYLRPITKAVRGWLAQTSYRRVEASVATTFASGHRWATLLGFQAEGPPRRAFMADGGDAVTYVRLKEV
jgi:hypothetical protein